MADISMCVVSDCPLSPSCRRHADSGTPPSHWQSFFRPPQRGTECEMYVPTIVLQDPTDDRR